MILNSTPQDQAVLSNVGQIGEFRIRNSAKAFNILSSGLYANKIRAIIRELSCNAVDSHVAAGNKDTPFDVHLPNSLEPWFSIRDYGTGLSHEQVTNIYTTYFESTKTDSNEFIGALGLGSKSPFSYTDNFTVTAVKNGIKGVYTAFINEQGVPSIAKMMEEETTDPAGVEVKFSVNDRWDFNKFHDEARGVYKYFKQRPVVSGVTDFKFSEPEYKDKDIVPGVHVKNEGSNCIAIMGNIAYPIDIPNKSDLGDVAILLSCGLVMEFDIGELDFQASREGLSYIPQTIDAIKRKLEIVNAQLSVHIAQEANKITGKWERSYYLCERARSYLWKQAVAKYVADTNFKLFENNWDNIHKFKLLEKDLQKKFNILIRGFHKSRHYSTCSNIKTEWSGFGTGGVDCFKQHVISVTKETNFVINDTKVGALERSKFHYRNKNVTANVYVMEAYDKTKPMLTDKFFASISKPPKEQIFLASNLDQKERQSSMGKNVTILQLEGRKRGYSESYVWSDAGKADSFDDAKTYYYIPLSGFAPIGYPDVKELRVNLKNSNVFTSTIYGVRKTDIEFIKTQKNWVELNTLVVDKLNKLGNVHIMGLVKSKLDIKDFFKYNLSDINENSPFYKLVKVFEGVDEVDQRVQHATVTLCQQFNVVANNVSPQALIDKYKQEVEMINNRYPLLKALGYGVKSEAVSEYVNLIDQAKGV
jgi:hypothetical protein